MKKKIAVLIRVYDRTNDLKINVQVIKDLWKEHDYDIFVCFNGKEKGYILDKKVHDSTKVIQLDHNAGHLKGNSQLLLEGMKHINLTQYNYLIILEADTWLMGDSLITKYVNLLDNSSSVWASSEWVENRYSVGVDFAIIDSTFISKHYKNLFNFTTDAEMWVAEYMMHVKAPFIFIKELMPVHRPSCIKSIYNADGARLRVFPSGNIVTHHIENLVGNMQKKKLLADAMYQNNYFTQESKSTLIITYYKYMFLNLFLKILPRSGWFKKKKSTFRDSDFSNISE